MAIVPDEISDTREDAPSAAAVLLEEEELLYNPPAEVELVKTTPHDRAKRGVHPMKIEGVVNWPTIIWIGMLHVGALAAPFTFSWTGLGLLLVMCWISGGLGICLGYHRLLTHGSFRTYPAVRWLLAILGSLAGEGSAIFWVATHRKHHALSDQEGDPHSPLDGRFWAHMWWLTFGPKAEDDLAMRERWAPDLMKDPVMRFLDRTFIFWHLGLGFAMAAVGYAMGGWYMAASLVCWGMFLRLVIVLHTTWFVNSATHIWGYRNYDTTDQSRNLWWVAALSYGEGWHNNHHAHPRMAPHGHKWWEVDLTFTTIRIMEKLGLAWDVVTRGAGGVSVGSKKK